MKKKRMFWMDKKKDKRGPFHYATANSFYSSPHWRRLRLYKLSQDPFCNRCLPKFHVEATEVHHVIPIDLRPDLALEINNTESLCHTCHSRETASSNIQFKTKGGIYTTGMKRLENQTP